MAANTAAGRRGSTERAGGAQKQKQKQAKQKPSSEAAPKGRRARAEAKRRERLDKLRAKSGNRWRIHYDTDGPRVRLGIAWFLGAMVAIGLGMLGVVVYFGLAFAAAASHALRTWRARGHDVDPLVALTSAAFVTVCAAAGPKPMGLGVLALVAFAVVDTVRRTGSDAGRGPIFARVGTVLQTTLPTGVAGGCVVLLADREIWAVITLVLLVSAYETGDYLIGSGAANALEGPLAGGAAVVVTALAVAALGVPPFDGVGQAMLFGVAVAPLAWCGQILASGHVAARPCLRTGAASGRFAAASRTALVRGRRSFRHRMKYRGATAGALVRARLANALERP